jgi:hypothetical protein
MKGQWIGGYTGSAEGLILVDADEVGDGFEGYAMLDLGMPRPKPYVRFRTISKSQQLSMSCQVHAVLDGQPVPHELLQQRFPDLSLPRTVDVTADWSDASLRLSWTTDVGTHGAAELPRTAAGQPSELQAKVMNWGEYKSYVGGLRYRDFVFRGQEHPCG